MEQIIILPKGQFTPLSEITLSGIISAFINLSLIFAAIIFVFSILTGGIKIILSGGNKEKLDESKRHLVNSLIGIVIVFSTWALLGLVSNFFGVDLLNFEIPTL